MAPADSAVPAPAEAAAEAPPAPAPTVPSGAWSDLKTEGGQGPFQVTATFRERMFPGVGEPQRTLYARHYPSAGGGPARGVLLVLHGYGEHLGKNVHSHVAFAEAGFHVFAYDHYAHGHSVPGGLEALRLKVDMELLISDASRMVHFVESDECEFAAGLPAFLFGHSMGGLIAAGTTLALQDSWKMHGVVLSAPALRVHGNALSPYPYSAPLKGITWMLSKALPRMKTPGATPDKCARTTEVREWQDPLIFAEFVNTFTGYSMVDTSARVLADCKAFTAPVFIGFGTQDALCDIRGAHTFMNTATKATDKTLKVYEGDFHELLNEPNREVIRKDMLDWIDAHLPGGAAVSPAADPAAAAGDDQDQ